MEANCKKYPWMSFFVGTFEDIEGACNFCEDHLKGEEISERDSEILKNNPTNTTLHCLPRRISFTSHLSTYLLIMVFLVLFIFGVVVVGFMLYLAHLDDKKKLLNPPKENNPTPKKKRNHFLLKN